MHKQSERFSFKEYLIFCALTVVCLIICVCIGSVNVPINKTLSVIVNTLLSKSLSEDFSGSVIILVRIPRVLCVALTGAILSLCGAAMQGLLQNPLADGSTMGVSSGASIGAILSIAFGLTIPGFSQLGTMGMAMLFAFISLTLVLSLAYRLDNTLSTYTIILLGVIFSMFANSILSLIITFSGNHVKNIMFWTMGSLQGSDYRDVLILSFSLLTFGGVILSKSRELNAFAIGEDNARSVGVNVKKVKLEILITVSALIGICVSIGGTIGFVGLVVPHMTRLVVGANHRKLLPACMFCGALFLSLADMFGRIIIRPLELPIGVVTSFIGSIVFVYIFYSSRRK